MTKETKIGLLVGTAIILLIAIFVSKNMGGDSKPDATPPLYNTASDAQRNLGGGRQMTTPQQPPANHTRIEQVPDLGPQQSRDNQQIASGYGDRLPRPIDGGGVSIFDNQYVPATQPTTQPKPEPASTIKVASGDTLSGLAAKHLGSAKRWKDILDLNKDKLRKPEDLRPDMVLKLPVAGARVTSTSIAHADLSRDSGTVAPVPLPPGAKMYVVQSGDTLSAIAKKTLGSATKWQLIYQANKQTIGPDAAKVKNGMKLVIPATVALPPVERATITPHPIPTTPGTSIGGTVIPTAPLSTPGAGPATPTRM